MKKSKFHEKKAQKVDFRIFMDPFWGFTLKTVLGIHDYSLEPKITKCRDLLYTVDQMGFEKSWKLVIMEYFDIVIFQNLISDTGQWIGVCNVDSRKQITSISKGCAETGVNCLKIPISLLQIDPFIGIKSLLCIRLSGYAHT